MKKLTQPDDCTPHCHLFLRGPHPTCTAHRRRQRRLMRTVAPHLCGQVVVDLPVLAVHVQRERVAGVKMVQPHLHVKPICSRAQQKGRRGEHTDQKTPTPAREPGVPSWPSPAGPAPSKRCCLALTSLLSASPSMLVLSDRFCRSYNALAD